MDHALIISVPVAVVFQHPDPAIHIVEEEMERKRADHQVEPRFRKMNDLDAVKRKQAGIWSRIDAVLRHVDQKLLAGEGTRSEWPDVLERREGRGGGITPGSMAARIS